MLIKMKYIYVRFILNACILCKTHTYIYMLYMYYFCLKLVFRALAENLCKCSGVIFSYRTPAASAY